MNDNRKVYVINPLTKGFQIDSTDSAGNPIKWGSSSKKNAVNAIVSKILSTHQIMIVDMGEVKNV